MKNIPHQDIIQWDVNSWLTALEYWEKKLDWEQAQNGLELGGREGGLALWLASKGKKVICSDLNNVKDTAGPLHKKYTLESLVSYENIDATQIPYENYFDVIVFKSILGGIGRGDNFGAQENVIKEIYKALKPGGTLLFAENMIASPLHQKLRKKFTNWGDSWRYLSITEINELLSDFSFSEIKLTGVIATFGRSENQRKILSYFDKYALNYMMPDRWKYIVYGMAVK